VASELHRVLSDKVVRRLAGERSYGRGSDYYRNRQVESLAEEAAEVHAEVLGSRLYSVSLYAEEGSLGFDCDCPQGADGAFCKHCVAAALAWLDREPALGAGKSRGKGSKISLQDAGKMLRDEDQETLVRMVLGWAKDDDRLRKRLLLWAARRAGPDSTAAAADRAFERAARIHGFVEYAEAAGWASGVQEAIDTIERLLEGGQAAAVVELCESALEKLEDSSQSIDDSDGYLTELRDRLEAIHLRASQEAGPDPVALARRLFAWELRGDLDIFYDAAERYGKILGEKGLQEYRRLAGAEWAKVPARTAKTKSQETMRHFRITHIMESLARVAGDIEQLVTVMSRDLSSAYSYLRIAEVYRDAGQPDRALDWAEQGLAEFPERTDWRLRELAAGEYHRRGRHPEAMKLIWAEFAERPCLETYRVLEKHAKQAGEWPAWRERALAEIRRVIAEAREAPRGGPLTPWVRSSNDHSGLVEIFLYEGDTEAAWREAQQGGCTDGLWLRLAGARETDHPADSGPVYLKLAEEAVEQTRNSRYEEAVELLVKAAAVMKRLNRGAEFVRRLEALRAQYRIKRNFIKLLEEKRNSLYIA
jgi:uncharacterized Zn finger protein